MKYRNIQTNKRLVQREWCKVSKTITGLSVEHLRSIQIGIQCLSVLCIYDNMYALVRTEVE